MPVSESTPNENGGNNPTSFEPVEPVFEMKIDSPHDDPTVKDPDTQDPRGATIRKRSREILEAGGFYCGEWLPTLGHRAEVPGKMRPVREVALRLMALDALFTWVNSPESTVSTDRLNAYISRNKLRAHLTEDERAILALSREDAHSVHNNAIGWRLENMWSLAWILGFDPPPQPMSGQIPNEISRAIVLDFLPGLDASIDDLMELEDVFYCAHNAVRSAQTGATTSVPKDFHPIYDGGAIHERRHSLTWAISSDVDWEEADLST